MNAHVCESLNESIVRDVIFKKGVLYVELDIEIDICSVKNADWWVVSHHLIVHDIWSNI